MAYKDKVTYQSWVNSNINTNGTGAITGSLMNEALIDMSDSVNWGIAQQALGQAVGTTPAVITFAVAFPSASVKLSLEVYDALGEPVDYTITNILATSFTVTAAATATLDWRATHN